MKTAMGLVIVAGWLLASAGLVAADEKNAVPACDAPKPAAAAEPAGKTAPRMVVTIDRETGRLRPATAAERAALAASGRRVLGRTGEATLVETRADGSKHVRLGPEFFRWSVALVNPGGTISYEGAPAKKAPAAPEK